MAHIPIIQPEDAEGRLREIYDDIETKRGKVADVHKIQSLHPETIVQHMDLYLELMYGSSPLTRAQREMIGVVVSAANRCEYCQAHHDAALNRYWKDEQRVSRLRRDFTAAELSPADGALCRLAWNLTAEPASDRLPDINAVKEHGLSDRAVLDAALIIAYFNFVNRIVLGLGVELEADEGQGYRY
jgi:uncharacterized peroxidase-related enzyme